MNSFGRLFRVTLSGESHGAGILVVLDGVPAGIALREADFDEALALRRPQTVGTTARQELDTLRILSGVLNGRTTGAPLSVLIANGDVESESYAERASHPRPGHADFVSGVKFFGFSDYRGGGIFSGRLTVGLVVAGVVARKLIPTVTIRARLLEEGGSESWSARLANAMAQGDSLGGVVECRVEGVEIGYGEPFFDALESVMAHLLFAIPGVKGVEFGVGFACARMLGSEYNDVLVDALGHTATNRTGGISGGISNGNELVFRVAIRPTASIRRKQMSYDFTQNAMRPLVVEGRHDVCFAQRVPVVVESVTAIVLADFFLIRRSQYAIG